MDRTIKNKRKAKYCVGCLYLHIGQLVDHNHCNIHYSDARTNGHGDKDIECPHKKVNLCKNCEDFNIFMGIILKTFAGYRGRVSKLRNGKIIACNHFKEKK